MYPYTSAIAKKGRTILSANRGEWSSWSIVYMQYAIFGGNDNHVTEILFNFRLVGAIEDTYSVQIKGGDHQLETIGPGTTSVVTITGNVNAPIEVRVKAHSQYHVGAAIDITPYNELFRGF